MRRRGVDDDDADGRGPVRARFAIDEKAIRREMSRIAEKSAARAASVSQMRVKEGIALTDRVGTGKMLNQIGVRRTGLARFQVYSDMPYAGWQEYGRGPVRPVKAKALRFKPKGMNAYVFARYVRPDPGGHFFKRALSLASRRDFIR